QTGGHQDVGYHLGIRGEYRTTVESEPAQPEQENTDHCQGQAVGTDGLNFAVHLFADTGPEHDGSGERTPSTQRVYDGGSGKIIEPGLIEPAAAPFPGTDDRVYDTYKEAAKYHKGKKLNALGNRSGYNGAGSGGEHALEQEVGPVGITPIC